MPVVCCLFVGTKFNPLLSGSKGGSMQEIIIYFCVCVVHNLHMYIESSYGYSRTYCTAHFVRNRTTVTGCPLASDGCSTSGLHPTHTHSAMGLLSSKYDHCLG